MNILIKLFSQNKINFTKQKTYSKNLRNSKNSENNSNSKKKSSAKKNSFLNHQNSSILKKPDLNELFKPNNTN